MDEIPNTNEIRFYLHCAMCLAEKPADVSPKDWSQIDVGWTEKGLQVWCKRHDANILHIDFEGRKHPANLTAIHADVKRMPRTRFAKHDMECGGCSALIEKGMRYQIIEGRTCHVGRGCEEGC